MEATLSAFREIIIPVDLGEEIKEIRVPFTVDLLTRVENTLLMAQDADFKWFRLRKSDKTVLAAYIAFCEPYFPQGFDFIGTQPTFAALFFSAVKRELLSSIDEFEKSMSSTVTQ